MTHEESLRHFVGEKRDPRYVRYEEMRKNSSGQIQPRVWQPLPGSGVLSRFINLVVKVWARCEPGSRETCALWSRRVQPIFLRQTRMTRITSGVQSFKRKLSAAVNLSRCERLYCGQKKRLGKNKELLRASTFRVSSLSIAR